MSVSGKPLPVVLSQIQAAKQELDAYPPDGFDWYGRAQETADLLIPWLVSIASGLKAHVEGVFNARQKVPQIWDRIKTKCGTNLPSDLAAMLDEQLERDSLVPSHVDGKTVSKVIEKYLIENIRQGTLESNGNSDYPDLFLRSKSYVGLPKFSRSTKEYGAALKGDNRPVRVPDGMEVKTCANRFAVDCHYPHVGLHLALLYSKSKSGPLVDDIMVAFLRHNDYRITQPKTKATTLKASFNPLCQHE